MTVLLGFCVRGAHRRARPYAAARFLKALSHGRDASALGWWGVPLAIIGGAIRVGTPLLWVSLGEAVTEKAGRINLGLEGTLLMGAMAAYRRRRWRPATRGWACWPPRAWASLLGAAARRCCARLNRVNDTAMGIALMLAGSGLAFWLGKPADPAFSAPDLAADRRSAAGHRPTRR